MNKLVLASGNKGKLAEFQSLLAPYKFEVVAQSDLSVVAPEETGLTFIENAILKARAASEQTGLPAIADDSGIAIDALDGEPGIYSARYAGQDATDQDNIVKALKALEGVPEQERSASFHCVLVFMQHSKDPTPIVCHGKWQGRILEQPAGEGGFGYDPIFWSPEHECSAAELTREQKSKISHRGSALRLLMAELSKRIDSQ